MKNIRVRREYFALIASGAKDREVRIRLPLFDAVTTGETLRFVCGKERIPARVRGVRRYRLLLCLVLREPAGRILPGAKKPEVYRTIRAIYPREKRDRGFVVIEFELV
jgi:ASC-1-like (ASCH) protein